MQVRARIEDDRRIVGKRRMRVEQVALVSLDLSRRVQHVARLAAVVDRHAVGDVGAANLGPLLELDDHSRVALRVRVGAGDQDVEALRRERKLELDEDPLVAKVGQLEDVGHRSERVPPRRDLGGRRSIPELVEEPVREHVRNTRLGCVGDELFARALVEMHAGSDLAGERSRSMRMDDCPQLLDQGFGHSTPVSDIDAQETDVGRSAEQVAHRVVLIDAL